MNLKDLVKNALYFGGYYRLRYSVKTSSEKRLLILMYHDLVKNDSVIGNSGFGKLTDSEFENHLTAIKDACRVVSVEEGIAEIKHGGGLKENSVALTFDDGFANVYEIAFPLLKKYGVRATVYLPTDWINGKMTLWWDELYDMIMEILGDSRFDADLARIGNEMNLDPAGYQLSDGNSRFKFYQDLSHEFMKIGDDRRNEYLASLRSSISVDYKYSASEARPMTWNQIKEMADAGTMFGAHTCSHINLSHADMNSAKDEISRSKTEIETRLGRKTTGFAYPYGYDVAGYARFIPLLEEIGFDYACTSWWGNNSDDSSLYQLLRNNLPPLKSKALLKRELYIDLSE